MERTFDPRQQMRDDELEIFHYKDSYLRPIEFHSHEFYEVYILLAGQVSYLVGERRYRLRTGDAFLIGNRELHRPALDSQVQTYERIVLWIAPEYLQEVSSPGTDLAACFDDSAEQKSHLLRMDADTTALVMSAANRLLALEQRNTEPYGRDLLRRSYLCELMIALNRCYFTRGEPPEPQDPPYSDIIAYAVRYISDHLAEDLPLERLAAECFLSRYHFSREFKRQTGCAPHRYIVKKRLVHAKSLIRQGMPLMQIHHNCGFPDYSNFVRAFRREYGLTPRQFSAGGQG